MLGTMTYERERVRWERERAEGEAKLLADLASLRTPSREQGSKGFQSAVSHVG